MFHTGEHDVMPRHFLADIDRELDSEKRDERWAWWLIGGSVLLIAAIGIFIA